VRRIAARLCYLNSGFIQQKLPDLCRAIVQKRKIWEARQLDRSRKVIKTACLEQPPLTLKYLSSRLGFNHSSALHVFFPEEVKELAKASEVHKREQRAKLRRELLKALDEKLAPSLNHIASRLGVSPSSLREKCPDLCKAISSRFLKSQRTQARVNRQLLNEAVLRIARDIHNKGRMPTHKAVCHLLNPSLIKDWSAIQKALRAARHVLGFTA
jgi:AraC-like DNA-binding protein